MRFMMLRAVKALGLPVPFTRDQINRLVPPKSIRQRAGTLDYDFQPQCFLDYLTQSEKITTPHMDARR